MSAESLQPETHQPNRVEMDADRALAIAEQAQLDPESLSGAEQHTLHGESITFDPRLLERMGDNGPIALINVGTSIVKVYDFDVTKGDKSEKRFAVTNAALNNDEVTDAGGVLALRFIDRPLTLGRTTTNAHRLSLAYDERVASEHFAIEADSVQLLFADLSHENRDAKTKLGTYVIVRERKFDPDETLPY